MMRDSGFSRQAAAAADQYMNESHYWLEKLADPPEKSTFPYDREERLEEDSYSPMPLETFTFQVNHHLFTGLMKLSKGSDPKLHMILTAGLVAMLGKYVGSQDIIVGTPIYKQEIDGDFINTVLPLRNRFENDITFRELLLQVRQTIVEASEHQNYPIEVLLYQLNMDSRGGYFPLFDIALLLENIHERKYLQHIHPNVIIAFNCRENHIHGEFQYNPLFFRRTSVQRIVNRFMHLLQACISDANIPISKIDFLLPEEKNRLLIEFNHTTSDYPLDRTVVDLYEDQAARNPGHRALIGVGARGTVPLSKDHVSITYIKLNEKANRLSRVLRKKGVGPGTIVAVMMEPCIDLVAAVLGILKAGGAWLPIDLDLPPQRIQSILKDSAVSLLLTREQDMENQDYGFSFTRLQGLRSSEGPIFLTPSRAPIRDFDGIPLPNRALIDYEKYYQYIGHAMVKNSLTLQATRGCPFNCAYCHRIWPKTHVFRSAENIFNEVKLYYHMGVKRFAFIDDIFNLNVENSMRFFRMILDHGLDVQFFFPAGLRGDIMTEEYIDLMIQAGTTSMALALETASPRLQKLIGKNLKIHRLHRNAEYICKNYPHVILELFTMHGFPTETEEEARMTLDFIKSLEWLHFPYINILKIYANTSMVNLALKNGITEEAIINSEELAHHELPETLPFPRSFTLEYQTEFLNEYFLGKERLLHVLPYQMDVLTEEELTQKYNSYIPAEINTLDDLLAVVNITREELGGKDFFHKEVEKVTHLNRRIEGAFPVEEPDEDALRVLLLDLSQSFSSEGHRLNDMVEPPLGLMYLMTHLQQHLGKRVNGRVYKALIDFNSYQELKTLLEDFQPDVIGIRTLIFYKESFHKAVAMIRHWGFTVPIIAGGPYGTSNYQTILQDRNVDLIVMGEGEITFTELITRFIENGGKMPPENILKEIKGLAFIPEAQRSRAISSKEILLVDRLEERLSRESPENPGWHRQSSDLLYTIYTSGSTGTPKGVLITNQNLVNYLSWFSRTAQLTPADKSMLVSSFAFDLGYTAVFSALFNGCELHIVPDDIYLSPEQLIDYIIQNEITYIKSTPSLFTLIANNPDFSKEIFEKLRLLVLGGEEINLVDVKKVFDISRSVQVMNHYGPTEGTIGSIARFIEPGGFEEYRERPTIGKPINNVQVYILDSRLHPVPMELAGELCLAGDCLAKGYLNRPELTAEKFCLRRPGALFIKTAPGPRKNFLLEGIPESGFSLTNAQCPMTNDRLYLTGDLAKWMVDGNIFFLGRIDQQVKIRGYRIEPGEIESHLLLRPEIKEVVVHAKTDNEGDKYLCAYMVFESLEAEAPEAGELKDYLSQRLPDYMVPAFFIRMDRIPLTANNKVDRRALPDPEIGGSGMYAAPVNRTQKTLAAVWCELLKIEEDKISIHDNFFELGGHSLKAVMLVSKVHKELNVKIPLAEIFKRPSIRELAEYIEGAKEERFAAIEPLEEREYYVLSSAQKRLYVLYQMEPGSIWYNTPKMMMMEGTLDAERMKETFRQMIMRHESLRTSFYMINGVPVQRIETEPRFEVELYDVSGFESGIGEGSGLSAAAVEEVRKITNRFTRPFDLSQAPLVRVGIARLGHERNVLMTDMHHIISDGTSVNLFINDFMALYRGIQLPPLRLQYSDYAHWQTGYSEESYQRQEEYWLQEFAGEVPVLNLPTDYPRPAVQSVEGRTIGFNFGKEETGAIRALAAEEEATLYMMLLAACYVLLSKLSSQEDIVVGTPLMGRRHADLEKIIGMFINTLVMRNFPQGGKTFRAFLQDVRDHSFSQFENQDYPFEDLVAKVAGDRDPSRNPLFDVMFILQNVDISKVEIPGMKMDFFAGESSISKFDISFVGYEAGDGVVFAVEYCSKLFNVETMERYIDYYKRIMTIVLENPDIHLSDIDILSEAEKNQILFDFNDTHADYPGDKTIHQLFAEQASRMPGRAAVIGVEQLQITYGELNQKTNQLAHSLREKGVLTDSIVGIMVYRSVEMIIGILGILKAGGVYLPIDPEYPQERIDYILKDSGARILLTDLSEGHHFHHSSNQFITHHSGNLAYVIYTSGSTGTPKGVMVDHSSVVNLLYAMDDAYGFGESDAWLLKTSYMFDVSVTELFGWFLGGGRLVVLEKGGEKDPYLLLDIIKEQKITHINFVPAMFTVLVNVLAAENAGKLSGLKYIFLAGEALPGYPVNQLRQFASYPQMENLYGPTEAAVYASGYSLSDWDGVGNIPIGRPLKNVNLYIIGSSGLLQPVGVPGELAIGGAGLARGYLNNPELTAEKFMSAPASSSSSSSSWGLRLAACGCRLYLTGDLARWLSDGSIDFLGRIDRQVKIRGFRIELGEIESHLLKHHAVEEVVVLSRGGKAGDNYLCAYIVPGDGGIQEEVLKEHLSCSLPDYMIPTYFISIEKVPLNPSGKVDRKALPAPGLSGTGENYAAPAGVVEEKLVKIWQDVLFGSIGEAEPLNVSPAKSYPSIGIDDNFFKMGGHSLKATILVARIHREMNVKMPLTTVFRFPTIRKLSQYIKRLAQEQYISIDAVELKEYYPLSSAQRRLYVLQQMDPGNTSYNVPFLTPLGEEVDEGRLKKVFEKLIARHEILRTSFAVVNQEPVQRVHDEVDFEIEYYDAGGSEMSPGMTVSTGMAEGWGGVFARSFDFFKAPLFRVGLVKSAGGHTLMLDMHHVITDGTSQTILANEFLTLYADPEAELPCLRLQYKDFSQWQNSRQQQELISRQKAYWVKEFSHEPPVLDLPTDFPRPRVQGTEGNLVHFVFNKEETGILKDIAKEHDVTLYMVLLAVFNILLSKLSGQEDIVLGTPIAARRHADLQHVLGMLVNTLVMRNFPCAYKTFEEFLKEIKQRTLEAYENQEYHFEDLVDHLSIPRDIGRNPLFDVMLNLLNQAEYSGEIPLVDEQTPYISPHEKRTSRIDMTFSAVDFETFIRFTLEYSTRLFTPATVERFIRYLKNIILYLRLPRNRWQTLGDIPLPGTEEKEEILRLSRGVEEIPEEFKTLHQLFEERVATIPDHTALVFDSRHLSYGELNRQADQLSSFLREKGVGSDMVVGLMVERSFEMIIGLLAILKAGGAYLPIDPEYPQERIDYMLKDSNARILVSELSKVSEVRKVGAPCSLPPASPASPSNLAYIIYTSGTTGKPKGIMMEHGNLVNLIHHQYKYTVIDFSRVLQFTTISFDVSAQEIFSTLLAGGQLTLIDKYTRGDVVELFKVVEKSRLKTLFLPASFLKFVMNEQDYARLIPGNIDHIVTAGEQLVVNETLKTYLQDNQVYLHNHYGPAETHVVTALTLAPGEPIPELPAIGKPIMNTAIYILDKGKNLVPVGVTGELVIGGIQVGRGYVNRPELTEEKFMSAPASSSSSSSSWGLRLAACGCRLYLTGDLGRWLRDGNIEFLGRVDHQVKVRGFRIEPGEIESQLAKYPGVKDAMIKVKDSDNGERYLCAYIVPATVEVNAKELKEYLSRLLPDYMIPAYFVFIEKIPLTPNGKVDWKALPAPDVSGRGEDSDYAAPTDAIEEKLVERWQEVIFGSLRGGESLHITPGKAYPSISIDANFFQLGGHSLKATILVTRIHQDFDVRVPLVEIFRLRTIRRLARYIRESLASARDKFKAIEPVEEKEYYLLSSAQERLYFIQQMNPGSTAYNMPQVIPLETTVNKEKLEQTFKQLIARHEIFRTSFPVVNEVPVQRIRHQVEFEIGSPRRGIHNFVRAFDLSKAPLLRVGLMELSGSQHLLLLDMHHIITDGQSQQIFFNDLMALYRGVPLPSLRIQYKDYARWQHRQREEESFRRQETFWLNELSGELPRVNLPVEVEESNNFAGKRTGFVIGVNDTTSLKEIAMTENATLYMVVLSIFNVLLSRIGDIDPNDEQVIVGTPVAGRSRADLQQVIGMFVNTLVLRNYPSGQKTFIEFLREVKAKTLAAFENQDYPFDLLVEKLSGKRDSGRNPVFDIMFTFNTYSTANVNPGIQERDREPADRESPTRQEVPVISKFDLTLSGTEINGQLLVAVEYRTALFKPETIERYMGYFKEIVALVIEDPERTLKDIKVSHRLTLAKPGEKEIDFDF